MRAGPRASPAQRPPSHHGEEEEDPPDRRDGPQGPGVPGTEGPAAGLPALRPGLRHNEAAVHREDAAGAGLGGREEGGPPLLAAGRDEALRSRPHLHPQVVGGGPPGAQLLADH